MQPPLHVTYSVSTSHLGDAHGVSACSLFPRNSRDSICADARTSSASFKWATMIWNSLSAAALFVTRLWKRKSSLKLHQNIWCVLWGNGLISICEQCGYLIYGCPCKPQHICTLPWQHWQRNSLQLDGCCFINYSRSHSGSGGKDWSLLKRISTLHPHNSMRCVEPLKAEMQI